MKSTDAKPLVNGVHMMEIQIDATNPAFKRMEAAYALARIDEKTGRFETHGRCTAYPSNWSQETMKRLHALLDSMEEDLLKQHFDVPRDTKRETEYEAEQV